VFDRVASAFFLNSSFPHCLCRINGIDYSIPPTLMKQSLVKVIYKSPRLIGVCMVCSSSWLQVISLQCGFKHRPTRLLDRHVPPSPDNMNLGISIGIVFTQTSHLVFSFRLPILHAESVDEYSLDLSIGATNITRQTAITLYQDRNGSKEYPFTCVRIKQCPTVYALTDCFFFSFFFFSTAGRHSAKLPHLWGSLWNPHPIWRQSSNGDLPWPYILYPLLSPLECKIPFGLFPELCGGKCKIWYHNHLCTHPCIETDKQHQAHPDRSKISTTNDGHLWSSIKIGV
jgi:hypothetical protein